MASFFYEENIKGTIEENLAGVLFIVCNKNKRLKERAPNKKGFIESSKLD